MESIFIFEGFYSREDLVDMLLYMDTGESRNKDLILDMQQEEK